MGALSIGDDRSQSTLFLERLDDYLGEDNPVRAVDVFVDELDLAGLRFGGVEPEATERPALPSGDAVEDLRLRVPQSGAIVNNERPACGDRSNLHGTHPKRGR